MTILLPPLPEERLTLRRRLREAWDRVPLWSKAVVVCLVLIAIAAVLTTSRYHGDVRIEVVFGTETRLSADSRRLGFGEVLAESDVQRSFLLANTSSEELEVGFCVLFGVGDRVPNTNPVCSWFPENNLPVNDDIRVRLPDSFEGFFPEPNEKLSFKVLLNGQPKSVRLGPSASAQVTIIARNSGDETVADYTGKLLLIARPPR